jgi:osmotically-inducible protein OsmY
MKAMLLMTVLVALLAGAGCAGRSVTDSAIAAKVKGKMAVDAETSALRINVDTAGGVVTLTGEVPTQVEKTEAEQVAKATEGVTRVINNIVVNPSAAGKPNVEEKAEEAVKGVQESGKNMGIMASDLTILSKIKARYISEGIIGANIDVKDGLVTLSGEVEDPQNKIRAESIAKSTGGVKSVDNQIIVK